MLVYNVISSMDMGNNTAVIIDGSTNSIEKGTTILNDNGAAYKVISYEDFKIKKYGHNTTNASLVIHGKFESEKVYI